MSLTSLLNDADVERFSHAVLSVLERLGILCQNHEMLQALEATGARVDRVSLTACFPQTLVRSFLDDLGHGDGASLHTRNSTVPGRPRLGTQIAQFSYDYRRREKRPGNRRDFVRLIQIGSTLHGSEGVGHCLLLRDVLPMLEPLEAALLLAEFAEIPSCVFAWNVRQADYLEEMGEILGLSSWYTWGAICIAHPFRFDRDVAARFVRKARAGEPIGLTAMPVAGVTTPATLEGFCIVSAAEQIAAWIAGRALNPAVPLEGSMWAGTMDLKTGRVSYSAFDAMHYAFAAVEFLRRWTGISIAVGGGEYCDSSVPGLYATLEKSLQSDDDRCVHRASSGDRSGYARPGQGDQ